MEACALNNLLCYYTENDVCMKVRGRRYIKFCQKQLFADVFQNKCS